jgi:Ca-activated chloride channel family protein
MKVTSNGQTEKRRVSTLALVLLAACGSDGEAEIASVPGTPSRSVTQGGPQDIGEFRRVVANQGVPAPELLDEVGFFAEHAIDLPEADCGNAVCVHPMLGVAPRFDGGNWPMAFVGLNTAVDPARLPKQPRHLILIAEDMPAIREILPSFAPAGLSVAGALSPEDRVSVIFTTDGASVTHVGQRPDVIASSFDFPEWPTAAGVSSRRPPDVYAALVEAQRIAGASAFPGYSQRVLWFTTGARVGVRSLERFEALAEKMAESGIAISVFGMGRSYAREVPAAVADIAQGNYYFVSSRNDLIDALEVEGKTAFVALARDFELSLDARAGYRIGRVYGARRAVISETNARLTTPTLFIGAREGATDVSSGRRGGGGGFFVELLADVEPDDRERVSAEAFTLTARYEDARTGDRVEWSSTISTPLGVGQNPPGDQPFFSDPARAKPFMMLNMYLALRAQVTLFQAGDCSSALGIENMISQSYSYWNQVYGDRDIDGDHSLMVQLSNVMVARCRRASPVPPYDFGGSCFMF